MNFPWVRVPIISTWQRNWGQVTKKMGLTTHVPKYVKGRNIFRGVKKGFFVCLFLYLLESETKAWPMSLGGKKKWVRHPCSFSPAVQRKMEIWNKKGGWRRWCLQKIYLEERERDCIYLSVFSRIPKVQKPDYAFSSLFYCPFPLFLRIFPLGVKGEWLTPAIESELEPVPSTLLSSGVHLPQSLILLSSMLTTKRHLSESGRMERERRGGDAYQDLHWTHQKK